MTKQIIALVSVLFLSPVQAFDLPMNNNPASQMMQAMIDMFNQMVNQGQGNNQNSVQFGSNLSSGLNQMSNPYAYMNPMTGMNPLTNMNPMTGINPLTSMNPMTAMNPLTGATTLPGMSTIPGMASVPSMTNYNPLTTMGQTVNPLNVLQNQTIYRPNTQFYQQPQQPTQQYLNPVTPLTSTPNYQTYLQPKQQGFSSSQPYYDKNGFRAQRKENYSQYLTNQNPANQTIQNSLLNPQYTASSYNSPNTPDLDGAWKSNSGEALIIKGNNYQIQKDNQITNAGTMVIQGNIITSYNTTTGLTKRYQYVKNGDLFMIRDAEGNTLMFQRLRYNNPGLTGQTLNPIFPVNQ